MLGQISSRSRCFCSLLAALTALFVLSPSRSAGIVVLANSLSARAESVADGNTSGPPDIDNINNPAVASQTFSQSGVTSVSSAEATYGSLKASGSISKTVPGAVPFNFATGTAMFTDLLTITGGTGSGTVNFSFKLTGELTDINAGESRATASLNIFRPGTFDGAFESFMVESGSSRTLNEVIKTGPLPFTFGDAFTIEVSLEAAVQLEETDFGMASSDLSNTAVLTALTVNGGTGPVTVSAASGTSYSVVPEPSSFLLVGLVASAIASSRRKRK